MFDGSPIRTIAQFGLAECATCVGPYVYTWRTRAVAVFIGRVNSRFMQPVSILATHLSRPDPIVSLCVTCNALDTVLSRGNFTRQCFRCLPWSFWSMTQDIWKHIPKCETERWNVEMKRMKKDISNRSSTLSNNARPNYFKRTDNNIFIVTIELSRVTMFATQWLI